MKATTTDFAKVGDRMRAARRALKLNQIEFHDKYVGPDRIKLRTYQRAETGANEAGMMLIESFVRAGINANWLLTGEGPMLLSDLAPKPAQPLPGSLEDQVNVIRQIQERNVMASALPAESNPQEPAAPDAPKINVDALVQAFCVSLATAPKGESTEQSARKAVQFYIYCDERGMLDPSKAPPGNAAA